MLSIWDLAAPSTDCKARVPQNVAAAIPSSKARMAQGEMGCSGKRGHDNRDIFVHCLGAVQLSHGHGTEGGQIAYYLLFYLFRIIYFFPTF